MSHVLQTEMTLPLPRDEVFAFFADAANLQKITPPELAFKLCSPLPIEMKAGALIDYRLKLFGLPFGWTTLISCWEPPLRFVDEQLRGPYRRWVHRHSFHEQGGSTLIADAVEYQLPGWPLGEAAYPLLRLQLQRIFAYRQAAIRRLLSPGEGYGPPLAGS